MLNPGEVSDQFVANQISFLQILKDDITFYDQLIINHTLNIERGFLSEITQNLDNELVELVYLLKVRNEKIYAQIYAKLKDRIDEVSQKIAIGEIEIKSFSIVDINEMLEKQLTHKSFHHQTDDLFRFREYLTVLGDALQEDIDEIQELEDFERKLVLQAQANLKRLYEKIQEELRNRK